MSNQKIIFLILVCITGFGIVSEVGAEDVLTRPNIINILVDDMGFSDLGSYGGEIETPNLDSLAASGIRYSNYRTYPKCHYTRNAILTGMDTPPARSTADSMTLAEALRTVGYKSYFIGKTHGRVIPDMTKVSERGFDRSFGNANGGNYWDAKVLQSYLDGKKWFSKGTFFKTDVQTDFALEFLDTHPADTPFFLYLAYHAPHYPVQAKPVDIQKYIGKYMEGPEVLRKRRYERLVQMGMIDSSWPLSTAVQGAESEWTNLSQQDKLHYDNVMATYAAMVDNIDQNIGRLLAKLNTMGVAENTIIFFSSDNGNTDVGSRGIWPGHNRRRFGMKYDETAEVGSVSSHWYVGRAWANLSNTPFSLYKNSSHEGGLSSSLIINFPTRLKKPGSIDHEPVSVFDIMPTAMQLAGVEYPSEFAGRPLKPLRGIDISPSFQEAQLPQDRQFFFFWADTRAFIDGKWKIVSTSGQNFDPATYKLYNLEDDRTEMNDISSSNPEKLQSMLDAARDYAEGTLLGINP